MSMEGSSGEVNPQDATASDVQVDALSKDTNAEIYENRGPKKIIRVVTVMAYLISVSFVAILLSAYYIFLWEPPNPRLIERGRLRADPQMQYLIATIPSEKTDLKKKGNDFLQTEVNREYKPFVSRIAYDGDNPKINSQNKKQEKLNAMLPKLRDLLVETHAQNRDKSKHETIISSISNNSSVKIEKMLNSTKIKAKNSSELHENTTKEKTGNSNIDPPEVTENTDPVNMLNIENTSTAATVPENKTKQKHFNERSDANLIVNHEKDNRNYQKKNNITKLYPVKSSDAKIQRYYTNDIINGSNYRALERNNSFKADEKFSKIDILDDVKKLKQDKSDDHQLINDNRKNDTNNVYTSTTSKKYTNDLTNHLLSINVSDNNSINFRRNYPSSNHTEEIARNEASTMSSFYDSEYIHNDSGSHQPLEYSTIVTRNSEGERIRVDLPAFLVAPR
ncbi:hypothetical protein EAG_05185 [Camponotus floridanus]|uniref:Uncharacterized protein n=1 Tax=Camponotus floridanus TaxID=104421 RepID=E2AQF5_CAMFO|nr:hypothetical protein EAG_05185 [Camponotus floridanus]